MYTIITRPLQFFYELWPNYAGAITLLTLSIMVLLLPLTLKGTRSMLAMQKLQPELKKLQAKHRDDRQKLNEEMMKFYKENNINPLSGCLPLLLQMPVFFILYRTLYQLIDRAPYGADMGAAVSRAATGVKGGIYERFGYFVPNHIDRDSKLFHDLNHTRQMRSFGLNLAESAKDAFGHGFGTALPYIVLVLAVMGTSFYQQRQIAGRNPQAAQANPQQQLLMKIMPFFFGLISFTLPAFIVVYFLVSNLFRIGQQALITRTLYRDEDTGAIATTGRASDKTSAKVGAAAKPKGFFGQLKEIDLPNPSKAKADVRAANEKRASGGGAPSGGAKGSAAKSGGGATKGAPASKKTTAPSGRSSSSSGPSRTAPSSANRSRAKKKRK
jgi:YidC/Oxa1 family membrane protein insertase